MTKDEALKLALEALERSMEAGLTGIKVDEAITALHQALLQPECNQHPDAPHGFNRESSHSLGRYVCDCEGWDPEEQEPVAHLWECIGRWSAYLATNGTQANCAPPDYLVEAINAATAPPKPAQDLIVGYADSHDIARDGHDFWVSRQPGKNTVPLYLYGHPPKIWQGLTDEAIWLEYQNFWPFHPAEEPTLAKDIAKFARAIEAKLKEKNT